MEPLALLREKIPSFPGYSEEGDRRLSGELVRSYLGEALARLRDRLEPLPTDLETKIDDIMVRAGFSNQRIARAFEDSVRTVQDFEALTSADAAVVEVADKSESVNADGLSSYLDEVAATLDRRDAAMLDYARSAEPI